MAYLHCGHSDGVVMKALPLLNGESYLSHICGRGYQ